MAYSAVLCSTIQKVSCSFEQYYVFLNSTRKALDSRIMVISEIKLARTCHLQIEIDILYVCLYTGALAWRLTSIAIRVQYSISYVGCLPPNMYPWVLLFKIGDYAAVDINSSNSFSDWLMMTCAGEWNVIKCSSLHTVHVAINTHWYCGLSTWCIRQDFFFSFFFSFLFFL